MKLTKDQKIKTLVSMEWEDFQKVNNEGGRASCQDDHRTFFIMRTSYFEPLSEDVIDCILNDFHKAHASGRNLLSEKYAWMMQSTSPDEFAKVCDFLPELDVMAKVYAELIVNYELEWMQDFAKLYPRISKHGRPILSSQDSLQQTSFETYLRGELCTYSCETLATYYAFVKCCKESGDNVILTTMKNEVLAYGYSTLEDAEAKL